MRIIVAAPGRAGGSLALAASAAGHSIVGVVSASSAFAGRFAQLSYDRPLPAAELLVVAAMDRAIAPTAARLAPHAKETEAAIHLSGFTSVSALHSLADAGCQVGSFHPLQSLPDPETGAASLAGAWVAVTAVEPLAGRLDELAASLSMRPFPLADQAKPLYHAGAAAASNSVVAALDLAERLFTEAGVPFAALQPLVDTSVRNAFATTPAEALTGPVARGDWATVAGHLKAVSGLGEDRVTQFRGLVEAAAIAAGRRLPAHLGEDGR
ncbi:MAG: DUF2520 domain-containing protein [Actinomycetota bacterium]